MKKFLVGWRGFKIPVGDYQLSIAMGWGNYCSNYSSEHRTMVHEFSYNQCENCELAILDMNDDFVTGKVFEEMGVDWSTDGMVAGYVTPEQIEEIIVYLHSKRKDGKDGHC